MIRQAICPRRKPDTLCIQMKDEEELRVKRAYWAGVYYTLDPEQRLASDKSQKAWLTAEAWLAALDWALGHATDTSTTLRRMGEDIGEWDT